MTAVCSALKCETNNLPNECLNLQLHCQTVSSPTVLINIQIVQICKIISICFAECFQYVVQKNLIPPADSEMNMIIYYNDTAPHVVFADS